MCPHNTHRHVHTSIAALRPNAAPSTHCSLASAISLGLPRMPPPAAAYRCRLHPSARRVARAPRPSRSQARSATMARACALAPNKYASGCAQRAPGPCRVTLGHADRAAAHESATADARDCDGTQALTARRPPHASPRKKKRLGALSSAPPRPFHLSRHLSTASVDGICRRHLSTASVDGICRRGPSTGSVDARKGRVCGELASGDLRRRAPLCRRKSCGPADLRAQLSPWWGARGKWRRPTQWLLRLRRRLL